MIKQWARGTTQWAWIGAIGLGLHGCGADLSKPEHTPAMKDAATDADVDAAAPSEPEDAETPPLPGSDAGPDIPDAAPPPVGRRCELKEAQLPNTRVWQNSWHFHAEDEKGDDTSRYNYPAGVAE